MKDERGPWYLLTGLILGLGFGLLYSWVISPVKYVDTAPASLRTDFKDQYRALIAAAFLSSGDLERARARLALLDDPDTAKTVADQAKLTEGKSGPESEKRGLALLAAELNPGSAPPTLLPIPSSTLTSEPTSTLTPTPVIALNEVSPTPTQGTPQATRTPVPTFTPLPTRTPTPTPGAPFILLEQTVVCQADIKQPLIQVETFDAAMQPVSGVEFIIESVQGTDHFFTGLKPELGLEYADFVMEPGVSYLLHLAEGGDPIPELTARECEAQDGSRYWGGWKFTFAQP
jgi:hypothetical protein